MNRRSFLTTAGATATCLAAGGPMSRKLYSQSGLDPNIVNPCVDNNAITSANLHYQSVMPEDFMGLAWANQTLALHFQDTGFAANMDQTIAGISPSSLDPNNFDYNGVTANLNRYCPEMLVSDTQSIIQPKLTQDLIAKGLLQLQQYGVVSVLNNSAATYAQVGAHLNDALSNPGGGLSKLNPLSPLNPRLDSRTVVGPTLTGLDKLPQYQRYPKVITHLRRPQVRPHLQKSQFAQQPFISIVGYLADSYASYNCTKDDYMMEGFAAEAAVVAICCTFGLVTGLLCGAILAVIAVVWGGFHIAMCDLH